METEYRFLVKVKSDCPRCKGTGIDPLEEYKDDIHYDGTCPFCCGKGVVCTQGELTIDRVKELLK